VKFILSACFLICFCGLFAGAQVPALSDDERDKLIDQALSFYYNGKPVQARVVAEILKRHFPEDAFFRELTAEIIWLELSQKAAPQTHLSKEVDLTLVKENTFLVEQFKEEIYSGLVLTQQNLNDNPNDSRAIFLRGMLKARYGGFVAKFESGLRTIREADRETAEGLGLIKRAIGLDSGLCSAKYLLGLTKYTLLQKGIEEWKAYIAIRLYSEVYNVMDRRLDLGEIFSIFRESMRCHSDYYFMKDVEIDKMFVFQDVLTKQAGRMDDEVLPVLEELNRRFPENKQIRDNLFLVRLHIRNKQH